MVKKEENLSELSVDELSRQKEEIEELLSSLEDEYRNATVSDKSYEEVKKKNQKRLDQIKSKLKEFGITEVHEVSKEEKIPLSILYKAQYAKSLSTWLQQSDLLLSIADINRSHNIKNIRTAVGCFAETYPLLVERAPSLALFTSVMLHGMVKQLEGVHIYPDGSFNLLKADLA